MEKHTPGPWEIVRYANYQGFSICANGAGCIAERWWPTKTDLPIEANARLIAAAPDLLAALKAAEEHISALCIMARDNTLYKWNSAGTVQTIHELRELIKKAES